MTGIITTIATMTTAIGAITVIATTALQSEWSVGTTAIVSLP
jgi:hypothetical protein